ncbi:hypothetical protein OIDMADRAFT_18321 [Oidiodendron maius Zn]|uniref:Uncharacterized protein n=1 Tax=Oidiodendron maius (strain Zn) TaxID=913774 RepID=A0A0C3DKE7_OIDMZ|nr:hypothetical protein OIDMADRAFT_18321 [Oidiodendron maius Zn]
MSSAGEDCSTGSRLESTPSGSWRVRRILEGDKFIQTEDITRYFKFCLRHGSRRG